MKLDIDMRNFESIKRELKEKDFHHAISLSIQRLLVELQREAMRESPKDTGVLASSWRTDIRGLWGMLYNTKEYAIFVHE